MKELMDIKRWGQSKWRMPLIVAVLAVVIIGSIWLNVAPFRSGFEITDELGGNIFPSSICGKPKILYRCESPVGKGL